jgi:hypothetical protein
MTYIYDQPCTDLASSGVSFDVLNSCQCCYLTFGFSNAINICPDSDLSIIGLPGQINSAASGIQNIAAECSQILNSNQCTAEFGSSFQLDAGTDLFNPLALPVGVPGTQPLSDVGSFTAFPGPQVTTISMSPAGYVKVITMAPWDAEDVAATATAATTGQEAGSTQSTGRAQSTGGATSAGGRETGKLGLVGLGVVLAVFAWQ